MKEMDDLKQLIADITTTDNVEKVAKISSVINAIEEKDKAKDTKLLDISNKYIDLVKNTGFKSQEDLKDDSEPREMSLEEYADEFLANKGEK